MGSVAFRGLQVEFAPWVGPCAMLYLSISLLTVIDFALTPFQNSADMLIIYIYIYISKSSTRQFLSIICIDS